jgi:hypothetical protein
VASPPSLPAGLDATSGDARPERAGASEWADVDGRFGRIVERETMARTIADIVVDRWWPNALSARFDDTQNKALATRTAVLACTVEPGVIEIDRFIGKVAVIAAKSAVPHVDTSLPRYAALWVMQSAHTIWLSAAIPRSSYLDIYRRPRVRLPMTPSNGEIVIFDSHAVHWLDGNSLFVALSADFDMLPSRADIEAVFLKNITEDEKL